MCYNNIGDNMKAENELVNKDIFDTCLKQTRLIKKLSNKLYSLSRIKETKTECGCSSKIEDIEINEIERQIFLAEDNRRKALRYITMLTGIEFDVLYMYYYRGLSWLAVSHELYFSERQIYHIRDKAIKHLNQLIKEEETHNDFEANF